MNRRCILISGAHPDDEVFFAGGTMALYADAGVRVVVSCATRGERGATAGLCSIDELPAVREREMRNALDILGVRELYFLGYEDQQLASASGDDVRRKLVAIIRECRPDIVITFDPEGVNLHADHVAISRFTTDAIAAAADSRWYPELGGGHTVRRVLWPSAPLVFKLSTTPALSEHYGVDFLIDTSATADRKARALRAHATQTPGFEKVWFQGAKAKARMSVEAFRLAWGVPLRGRPSPDIFEGMGIDAL